MMLTIANIPIEVIHCVAEMSYCRDTKSLAHVNRQYMAVLWPIAKKQSKQVIDKYYRLLYLHVHNCELTKKCNDLLEFTETGNIPDKYYSKYLSNDPNYQRVLCSVSIYLGQYSKLTIGIELAQIDIKIMINEARVHDDVHMLDWAENEGYDVLEMINFNACAAAWNGEYAIMKWLINRTPEDDHSQCYIDLLISSCDSNSQFEACEWLYKYGIPVKFSDMREDEKQISAKLYDKYWSEDLRKWVTEHGYDRSSYKI